MPQILVTATNNTFVSEFAGARNARRENPLHEGDIVRVAPQPVVVVLTDNEADQAAINAATTTQAVEDALRQIDAAGRRANVTLAFQLLDQSMQPIPEARVFAGQLARIHRLPNGKTLQATGVLADAWHSVRATQGMTMQQQFAAVIAAVTPLQTAGLHVHLTYATNSVGRDITVVHLLSTPYSAAAYPNI